MIRKFNISITTNREINSANTIKDVRMKLVEELKAIEVDCYGREKFSYGFDRYEMDEIYGPSCYVNGAHNACSKGRRPTTYGADLTYSTLINEMDVKFFKNVFDFLMSIKWRQDTTFKVSFYKELPKLKHDGKFRTMIEGVTVEYDSFKDGKDFNFDEFAEYALTV